MWVAALYWTLYFVENWLSIFKCANISKDISQQLTTFCGVLANPTAGVGIGANGDNLATQFLESAEKF